MTSMDEDRSSTENETPVDPWVEMLVGRQWEIYWELNSDYEDDWYDAVCPHRLSRKHTVIQPLSQS
jgi:hypothetical protein